MKSKERLMIAETSFSNYSYHLRLVKMGEEKYSGSASPAICGAELGWDTKIPLSAWGTIDHIPSRWCSKCDKLKKSYI